MRKESIETIVGRISGAPILAWILPGFFLSYLAFFLLPVFITAPVMQFFQYIPSPDPIGVDLKQTLDFSRSWLSSIQTPYVGTNLYPPLSSALFAPLLVLDFASAYRALTLLTTVCYVVMTLGFPVLLGKDRNGMSAVLLVLMTGLFSYGFQFELERGQFDVISVFLAFLAIWIFHYHSRHSILAYALFTISVQLKIYPLIFVFMLIRDWRDWGKNIARISVLALVNFALLFALGPGVFLDFMHSIGGKMAGPYIWVGNHSITAFTTLVVQHAAPYGWSRLNQYSGVIQFGLFFMVAACLCLVWSFSRRREASGIDVYLLLVCTIGSLLIPPTSNDYKLSILAAPVAMFYAEVCDSYRTSAEPHRPRLYQVALVFVLSAAYASTLFSFVGKPATFVIANNFPALMVMLVAVTVLSSLKEPRAERSSRTQLGTRPEVTQRTP
jgi:hypothetical protein